MKRQEVLDFCSQLYETHQDSSHYSLLSLFADKLGFDQVIYVAVPSFYTAEQQPITPKYYTTFPTDWIQYYQENQLHKYDAAFSHALSGSQDPHIWPEQGCEHYQHHKQTLVLKKGRSMGLGEGFTLPIHNTVGAIGAISFATTHGRKDFDNSVESYLRQVVLFSQAYNESILRAQDYSYLSIHEAGLTPRELDVLRWQAVGMSYSDIADRYSIGISTIKKHVQSILKKLRAKNSSHACAIAIRNKII